MFKPTARSRAMAGVSGWREKIEKLRSPREARAKAANISSDGRTLATSCTIRDMSATGLRISTPRPELVPDEFLLMCAAEDLIARVRVAWRKDREMGVRFLRKGTSEIEGELRQNQAVAYAAIMEAQERAREQTDTTGFAAQAQTESMLAHFRLMGLDPTLSYTPDQIKQTYRVKAMRAHPDHGGSVEDFQALTKAYQFLEARFSA